VKKILIASENSHKIGEFRNLFGGGFEVHSLNDYNFSEKLPSEGDVSYEENANVKARYVGERLGMLTLGDDSGFEVDALHGEPGIHSARFMGTGDSVLQRREILRRLKGQSNRKARFVCVLAAYDPILKRSQYFRGEVNGKVSDLERGTRGFGYDPIFIPDEGDGKTFAEMSDSDKNRISHRSQAVALFRDFLKGS